MMNVPITNEDTALLSGINAFNFIVYSSNLPHASHRRWTAFHQLVHPPLTQRPVFSMTFHANSARISRNLQLSKHSHHAPVMHGNSTVTGSCAPFHRPHMSQYFRLGRRYSVRRSTETRVKYRVTIDRYTSKQAGHKLSARRYCRPELNPPVHSCFRTAPAADRKKRDIAQRTA